MKKNILIIALYFTLFSIIPVTLLFCIKKIFTNKKKLTKIIAEIIAFPIYKKDKKLLNELLDLIIKIFNITTVSVITKKDEFHRTKYSNKNSYNDISEDIKYKNMTIGLLKISFI